MEASGRVAIVQRSLRRYREPFFRLLRQQLLTRGIELQLVHNNSPAREKRGDPGSIPWAVNVPAKFVSVGGNELVWQPCVHLSREVDLVVVEQASVLLLNYLLVAGQRLGGARVAFWGHGANFNTNARSSLGEKLKRGMSRQGHWWFPYTEEGAEIVADMGFPRERISVVYNATDTRHLASQVDDIKPAEVAALRNELGLHGSNVGVFVGALSPYKKFDFLFEAADCIRSKVTDFELIVVGGGPMSTHVSAEVRTRPWARHLDHRFDRDLAVLLRLAKVMLVPGWAGLVVVDSFAAGVPLVASRNFPHPPEISYLRDAENGLVVDDDGDAGAYADAVIDLLSNDDRYAHLVEGCLNARRHYSIEKMVDRFTAGIEQALAEGGLR